MGWNWREVLLMLGLDDEDLGLLRKGGGSPNHKPHGRHCQRERLASLPHPVPGAHRKALYVGMMLSCGYP